MRPNTAIVQKLVGGGEAFLMGEHDRFLAQASELDDGKFLGRVAQQLNQMKQVFHRHFVDGFHDPPERVRLAFGKFVGKKW